MTSTDSVSSTITSTVDSPSLTSASISSDFNTWISLLTAQLQNQDPFDPVDSTEYTAQLAQFSAVEQQVRTNDLLAELVSVTTASDLADMAEWVGKEVRVDAPVEYAGTPISIYTNSDPVAFRAELVVRDRFGTEIDRFMVSTGESEAEWKGLNASGDPVPWEEYSFEVESFDAEGNLLATSAAETYAEVLEVQRVGDSYSLIIPGGTAIDTSEVSAVRSAAS